MITKESLEKFCEEKEFRFNYEGGCGLCFLSGTELLQDQVLKLYEALKNVECSNRANYDDCECSACTGVENFEAFLESGEGK